MGCIHKTYLYIPGIIRSLARKEQRSCDQKAMFYSFNVLYVFCAIKVPARYLFKNHLGIAGDDVRDCVFYKLKWLYHDIKSKNKRTKEQKDNPYNATPLKVLLVVYMNVVNSRTKEKKGASR